MSMPGLYDAPATALIEEKVLTANGDLLIRRYQRGKFLGRGGFATCFELTDLDSQRRYAAKIVQKEFIKKSRAKQKLMSEIRIHSALKHSGIVGFEHSFEDAKNVYILLEICSNETLHEIVRRRKRLAELEVQSHVLQVVEILRYLQEHKVIHRDLKLSNLFLSEKMEIKLGDFGLATKLEFKGERKRTICGTPNYIAPEVLDRRLGHSYEVDIWSLGVVMYAMVVGKPPFETDDVQTTYNRIRANSYSFPEGLPVSQACKDLIGQILVTDPAKRPTLDEILESPFMTQGYVVPRLLPASTLSCPLSTSYIEQVNRTKPKPPPEPWVPFITTPLAEVMPLPDPPPQIVIQPPEDIIEEKPPGTDAPEQPLDLRLTPDIDSPCAETDIGREAGTWIVKWMDYSSKYGLGYVLNNGCAGVYFNDCSKILLLHGGERFRYINREAGQSEESIVEHYITDPYPLAIQKKVTLLQHFRSFLGSTVAAESPETAASVYVKKWLKSKHAVLFRFSNKVIQVVFKDRTEVLLSSDTALLTYVNKAGERRRFVLDEAQEDSSSEVAKRVKYTMELLAHLLGKPRKKV